MPQGPFLRKYGVETTVNFQLFGVTGVDFKTDASHASGDTKIMKDEGAEANTSNGFTDEGQGYAIVLTATEMQAARIVVYVVDSATKVWLDTAIIIETYGNASAMHAFDLATATQSVNVSQISGDTTAADNAEAFFDGTGYAGTNNVIPTVTTTTTATNVTTVNGLAANVITATSIANDAITAAKIATGAIDADAIADNAIDAGAIAADAITAAKIADGAIDANTFAAGAITASAIAADAIGASELDADAVTEIQSGLATAAALDAVDNFIDTEIADIRTTLQGLVLAKGTIGSTGNDTTHLHLTGFSYGDDEINNHLLVIFDNSTSEYHARWIEDYVGATDLATVATLPFTPENAVDTYWLLPIRQDVTGGSGLDAAGVRAAVGLASANLDTQLGAIDDLIDTEVAAIKSDTAAILADTGTDGVVLASGSITAAVIATGAIDADAIADNAIDAGAIASNAITSAKIADDAITAAKIADGAIDAATFAAGAITATVIANDAITAAKIADGAIDANTFATGAITAAAIAADAIGASELAADAVTEIQSGLATAASIAALNNLSAAQVNSEVDTALADIRLDELLSADSDIDGAAPPTVGSVFHELMTKTAGSFTYDQTTDSLEAIKDSALTAAQVNTEADTALADYDGPTHAELVSEINSVQSDIAALNNLSAAQVNSEVDTALSDYGALRPTTAGRTLDVSAGGEAGIDWANIGSPATSVNLSATNIDTDQVVASVTGAVGSVTGNVGGNVAGSVASVTAAVTVGTNNDKTGYRLSGTGVDDILDEALTEPAATFTWAGATLRTVVAWLGALARNKRTTTSTTETLRNDADNANISTATISDDNTTFTRNEWS